jgi:hypothetical protein
MTPLQRRSRALHGAAAAVRATRSASPVAGSGVLRRLPDDPRRGIGRPATLLRV